MLVKSYIFPLLGKLEKIHEEILSTVEAFQIQILFCAQWAKDNVFFKKNLLVLHFTNFKKR